MFQKEDSKVELDIKENTVDKNYDNLISML